MKTSNFENRVSLTQKNESLSKQIEELSASYNKRLNYVKNFATFRTSEICTPPPVAICGIWVIGAAVLVIAVGAWFYAACKAEVLPCNDFAMVDNISFKNYV
jgi:hypothetical protein